MDAAGSRPAPPISPYHSSFASPPIRGTGAETASPRLPYERAAGAEAEALFREAFFLTHYRLDYAEARGLLERVLALDGGHVDALTTYGFLLYMAFNDYANAEAMLRRALRAAPSALLPRLHLDLVRTLQAASERPAASPAPPACANPVGVGAARAGNQPSLGEAMPTAPTAASPRAASPLAAAGGRVAPAAAESPPAPPRPAAGAGAGAGARGRAPAAHAARATPGAGAGGGGGSAGSAGGGEAGSGGALGRPEEPGEMPEEAPATLEARLACGKWSVRAHAYRELACAVFDAGERAAPAFDQFGVGGAPEEPWAEWGEAAARALADANVAALGEALALAEQFAARAPLEAARALAEAGAPLVLAKGLAAPRLAARAQALLAVLVEAGGGPSVVPQLVGGMSHKVPKVAGLCAETVTSLLDAFGPGVVDPALVLPAAAAAFDSTLAPVRAAAVPLACALVRRGGPPVRRAFDHLRAVQARDLDAALAAVAHDPRSVTRRLRAPPGGAAPDVRVGAAGGGAAGEEEEEGGADSEAPPVDVLALVPGDLAARLLAPGRWQDKRELLDMLVAAAEAPAIAPGDYSELVRALRVLLGDSMVLLVQSSIRALGLLGAGLGAGFRAEACALASPLLDKLKDKNRGVVEATHRTLDLLIAHACSLDDLEQPLRAALGRGATPRVRAEALKLLARSLAALGARRAPAEWWVTGAVLETLDDGSGEVRDQAAAAAAPLVRLVGARAVFAKADAMGLDPKRRKRLEASAQPPPL